MTIEHELAKRMAALQADLDEQALLGTAATGGAIRPAGLTGTGLTLRDLVQVWDRLEQQRREITPWMRWLGKAQLKLDEGNWLPASWPAVVIQLADGVTVYVKPAALDEIRRDWRELGQAAPYGHVFRHEPTDEEVAAMFAWLAEVQAAREGKPALAMSGGGIMNLDLA